MEMHNENNLCNRYLYSAVEFIETPSMEIIILNFIVTILPVFHDIETLSLFSFYFGKISTLVNNLL